MGSELAQEITVTADIEEEEEEEDKDRDTYIKRKRKSPHQVASAWKKRKQTVKPSS